MKAVVAIITVLLLLVSQAGAGLSEPAANPCCGTCAGECCIKAGDTSAPSVPLAPVSASPAPALKLAPPPIVVCGELLSGTSVAPFVAPRTPLTSQPLPLFLRQCVLLL